MSDSTLYSGTYSGTVTVSSVTYPFTVDEKRTDSYDEGSGGQTITMNYALQSEKPIDLDTARAMANAFVTAKHLSTRESLPLSTFSLEHDNEEDLDRYWSFSLEWTTPSSSDSGGGAPIGVYHVPYEEDENWSTEGGTAHITDAVWKPNPNGEGYVCGESVTQIDDSDPGPSTFNGRIGWNGESADGVDVVRPAFSFTLKKKVLDSQLDLPVEGNLATLCAAEFGEVLTYRQILIAMTGTVNNAAFRGWSAGNVLFEGVSSSPSVEYNDDDPEFDAVNRQWYAEPIVTHNITFKFKCNFKANVPVGASKTVLKEGFQYLWIYSRKLDDSTTGVTLEYPQTAVVSDVYTKRNFALLGF